MDYRDETEVEHRSRDEHTWGSLLVLSWLFPGMRWIWLPLLVAVAGIWAINILGESGALNSASIVYVGKDPRTGEMVAVKGCRPEKVRPDGSCDQAISLELARQAFPHWGDAKQLPVKNSK
jgi:hypothetical protein